MPKHSAGLLPFRISEGNILEVFIVHPGGPFWAKKDQGAWSVSKGEYEPTEDASDVANREFTEELGMSPPLGARIDLGELKQPSGKRIHAWAIEAPAFEVAKVVSNQFELEWPPKSGSMQLFPEVDRAAWFPASKARSKLLKGQVPFIDQLIEALRQDELPPFRRTGWLDNHAADAAGMKRAS